MKRISSDKMFIAVKVVVSVIEENTQPNTFQRFMNVVFNKPVKRLLVHRIIKNRHGPIGVLFSEPLPSYLKNFDVGEITAYEIDYPENSPGCIYEEVTEKLPKSMYNRRGL